MESIQISKQLLNNIVNMQERLKNFKAASCLDVQYQFITKNLIKGMLGRN